MTSFNQDDQRERAMVAVLNLAQRSDRARQDEDAHMDVDYGGRVVRLLFELKSAPADGDFGTGRDTGVAQLRRWSSMHFVFGWFAPRDNRPQRLWYGSPAMMRAWNTAEQEYLAPDLTLTEYLPDLVSEKELDLVLGRKATYTYEDLRGLMKDLWNAKAAQALPNRYVTKADVRRSERPADCIYSRDVAMDALRDRVRYLLARGSTVNNRKISRRYVFTHCQEIAGPRWSSNFEAAIMDALAKEPPRI